MARSGPGVKEKNAAVRLRDAAPGLENILTREEGRVDAQPAYLASDIRRETVWVAMRDNIRLATDLYLPPVEKAPAIGVRTPYGRKLLNKTLVAIAQRGYIVISQDCRGTGDSEPNFWDYFLYETDDGFDFVEWVTKQIWFDGFLGSCGGSYVGSTQWAMALHPRMSAIAPEVAGLCVVPWDDPNVHLFQHAYSRSVGKGVDKVPVHFSELERLMMNETLASGYFNDPLHLPLRDTLLERYPELRELPAKVAKDRLWQRFSSMRPAERADFIKLATGENSVTAVSLAAMVSVFGHHVPFGLFFLPQSSTADLVRSLKAPPLMIAGWYDWGLRDALATWELFKQAAPESVRTRGRLIITPAAHNMPGYHEGMEEHPELRHNHRTANNVDLLLSWYQAIRDHRTESWPSVIYYLMGANEWRVASDWPVPEAEPCALYLGSHGTLSRNKPQVPSEPDAYTYDPSDPTPTIGGSIVSYVYPPGSVDVSEAQKRPDVLIYTTPPFESDLDVVGPLRLVLYASSDAVDTDFAGRLSDVFPDGRAIQLQNGVLRLRYRDPHGEPVLMEPGRIYRLEIDLWATANRFKAGHRLRLDISSADFPRFDRNMNRGGQEGNPITARQTIHHDAEHPSHLLISVLRAH